MDADADSEQLMDVKENKIFRYVASCITLKSKSNWTLNVVPRVYIETKDGAKDEIGDGYSVGPGESS